MLGYEPIPAERLAQFVRGRPDAEAWAQLYADFAPIAGIRTSIAFAQACHETGFFTFTGRAQADWNNPCGLGVGASSGAIDCHFPSKIEGVRAHLGHLVCYFDRNIAHARGFCEYDPRHVTHRGLINDATELGGPGRWAPGTDYGSHVLALAEQLLSA